MNTTNSDSLEKEQNPILGHNIHGHGAEKVIVFHDWMGDATNYEPLKAYLDQERYSYVFLDMRGYGKSSHLTGDYTAAEAAADAFTLADHLGWDRFHALGHSMAGMVVQQMALDEWNSDSKRVKSVVAITPVSADGYPADEGTKKFLWELIGQRELSEQGFFMLTGQRLLPAWGRLKTRQHLNTSTVDALKGYYRMWLESDFSDELKTATIGTPFRVIGGRQDLPGFQEEHLRKTFGTWLPNVDFEFISDAGHYPMQETPVYLATLVEQFIGKHS